jgi:hypothetical protein
MRAQVEGYMYFLDATALFSTDAQRYAMNPDVETRHAASPKVAISQ